MNDLHIVQDIARRHSDLEDIASLCDLLHSFAGRPKKHEFAVAVLGGFSRGKSTFINALLGAEVVPTSVLPSTAVYTRIRYGQEPGAELWFDDKTPQAVTLEEAKQYVATDRQRVEGLRAIQIRYPSPYLQRGVAILDAPGFGSVYPEHRKISLRCVAEADAAVFVMSSEPLLSAWECEFIREARHQLGWAIFVQTKIDQYHNWHERLTFNLTVLEEQGKIALPRIYPISSHRMQAYYQSRAAIDYEASRFQPLEQELAACLGRDRAQIAVQKQQAMVHFGVKSLQRQLELALMTAQASLAGAKQQLAERKQMLDKQTAKREVAMKQSMAALCGFQPSALQSVQSAGQQVCADFERYVSEATIEELETEAAAQLWSTLRSTIQRLHWDLNHSSAQAVQEARRALRAQLPASAGTGRVFSVGEFRLGKPSSMTFDVEPVQASKRSGHGTWGATVGGVVGTLVAPGVGTAIGVGVGGVIGRAIKKKPKVDVDATREAYLAEGRQVIDRRIRGLRRRLERQLNHWLTENETDVRRYSDQVYGPAERQLTRQIAELEQQVSQISQQAHGLNDDLGKLRASRKTDPR